MSEWVGKWCMNSATVGALLFGFGLAATTTSFATLAGSSDCVVCRVSCVCFR